MIKVRITTCEITGRQIANWTDDKGRVRQAPFNVKKLK